VRIEHIGVHNAANYGGAQFFVACGQIEVTGGGSGSPGPLVAIPGEYKADHPGIYFNNYYPAVGPHTEKQIVSREDSLTGTVADVVHHPRPTSLDRLGNEREYRSRQALLTSAPWLHPVPFVDTYSGCPQITSMDSGGGMWEPGPVICQVSVYIESIKPIKIVEFFFQSNRIIRLKS
jgi:hypothetical protein